MGDDDGVVEELASRLLEKQERAAERRERILDEKRQQLLSHERERQRKIEQIKRLRATATDAFIKLSPQYFAVLRASGLVYSASSPMNPEFVEQILVSDPRVCEHCDFEVCAASKTCAVTGKPHRRSLIVAAEKLLKLIGDTRVNLTKSSGPTATISNDSVPAVAATNPSKAKRGISVNPQLFVLAYFNSVLDPHVDDIDPLLQQSAQHLLHVTELLRATVSSPRCDDDVSYVTELLGTFAKAWLRYAKVADGAISLTPAERDTARSELITATRDTYISTWNKLQTMDRLSPDGITDEAAQLLFFLEALEVRLRSVGGDEEVERLRAHLERESTATSASGPPSTPEHRPAKPNALTGTVPVLQLTQGGTSGSETDRGDSEKPTRSTFGPSLPPLWHVDAEGISQPPTAAAAHQQTLKDTRERLEFRAAKAYEAKTQFNITAQPAELASAIEALDDETLELLRSEINAAPPKLERVPAILNNIVSMLVEALPKKLRSRVGQELRDVLDWNMVRRSVRMNETNISEFFRYVVGKVIELGAPARVEELQAGAHLLTGRLARSEEDVGLTVADMFRFMTKAIKQLRSDVANFTLAVMNEELARNCITYQQEFFKECFSAPQRWNSTLNFLQQQINSTAGKDLLSSIPPMPTAVTDGERRLYAALVAGTVDLLRSSTRTFESRWANLPLEGFYFERPILSECANTVQLSTLRLMLTGTVSMLIAPKKFNGAAVSEFLVELDKRFLEHINATGPGAESPTLTSLVDLVSGEVAHFCSNQVAGTMMSTTDNAVLRNVVGKMISTDSQQYMAFEERVLRALQQVVLVDPREASKTANTQKPRILGLVSDAVYETGAKLRRMIDHNWETMRGFYCEMLSALEIEEMSLAPAMPPASSSS